MGRDNIHVGLEVGTSKVCAVVGESRPDGTVRILGVGQAPARGVRKGEIADFQIAGKCIREALVDAEEKSDVAIGAVYLSVTGGHIRSFNNRGAVNIPEERGEICDEDFEEVQSSAREVSIPPADMFLHSILQHYYVDGRDGILNPMGMLGRRLEADFHIIHGDANRVKTVVRCVKEIGPEVRDVVFAPLATAQVVLDTTQKGHGALVIDMGGGTTDYIAYVGGAVKASGCLPVGGDHITNDIAQGLRLPTSRSERLKIEEGCALIRACQPGDRIVLKDEAGFAGRDFPRESLNTIIEMRLREVFEVIRDRLNTAGNLTRFITSGLMLTGGCSQLRGVQELAEEVFGMPVHITHAQTVSGHISAFENPQFSTAIGLTKYAQAMHPDAPSGFFQKIRKKLPFFGLL